MHLLESNGNFSCHLYDMKKRKELPAALLSQKHSRKATISVWVFKEKLQELLPFYIVSFV